MKTAIDAMNIRRLRNEAEGIVSDLLHDLKLWGVTKEEMPILVRKIIVQLRKRKEVK